MNHALDLGRIRVIRGDEPDCLFVALPAPHAAELLYNRELVLSLADVPLRGPADAELDVVV